MALINIDPLKPAHVRIIAATCLRYGYQALDANGAPNPESQDAFTTRVLKEQIINMVRAMEAEQKKQAYIAANPVAELTV